MTMDRVRIGVLLYLLLICLASVVTCLYLLWQLATGSEARGPEWILLTVGVVWGIGVLIYLPRLLRPAAGESA